MSTPCSITITHNGISAPLLSNNTVMGCWSWSLPAGKEGSCPMEDRSEGSICNHCYAKTGRFTMSRIMECQKVRLLWTKSLPAHKWTNIMKQAIRTHVDDDGYFRVHDSGDFYGKGYIERWATVCRNLPTIRFWIPTRAWVFPSWLPHLRNLHHLPNVQVTPSAIHIGADPPTIPGLGVGLTSHHKVAPKNTYLCPKSINRSSCTVESCRHCWLDSHHPVSFKVHGYPVTLKIQEKRDHAFKDTPQKEPS